MGWIIIAGGTIFLLLFIFVTWAILVVASRNESEYYKCDAKVTYYYGCAKNRDEFEWEDETQKVLIIRAYRREMPPAGLKDTFYQELKGTTIIRSEGGQILWDGSLV